VRQLSETKSKHKHWQGQTYGMQHTSCNNRSAVRIQTIILILGFHENWPASSTMSRMLMGGSASSGLPSIAALVGCVVPFQCFEGNNKYVVRVNSSFSLKYNIAYSRHYIAEH
jgi:hypothetical protein